MNQALHRQHMLSRIEGIIFDLDGTLWNAIPSTVDAWNAVLRRSYPERTPLTEADLEGVTGKPFETCVDVLFPGIQGEDRESLIQELDLEEKQVLEKRGGQLFPQVGETLSKLALSYDLFIVSNCQKWYLQNFFQHFPVSGFFKGWDCHGMSECSKARMLQDIRSSYVIEDIVYVGDTSLDFAAAEEIGIPFIHAAYGFDHSVESPLSIECFSDVLSLFP